MAQKTFFLRCSVREDNCAYHNTSFMEMKRIQLEPWTPFDKHCLTSAISKVGDQNWTAVSRATRNVYEDSIKWLSGGDKRSIEWFSNKQCAAQYEHLLKNVPLRRKKRSERSTDQVVAAESPADILQQTCRHEFMEDLKKAMLEEQALYLKLAKEYDDIQAGRLDYKLEEMQEEYDAKEREKEIKMKLKFKLGEKSLSEAPNPADGERLSTPTNTPTTPVKLEKEIGSELHKTNMTTSPLLTSLLQSPSPLVRTTSTTPTISLLLNTSPSIPSNESPTLSKLLENTCSTPAVITTIVTSSTVPTTNTTLVGPIATQPSRRASSLAITSTSFLAAEQLSTFPVVCPSSSADSPSSVAIEAEVAEHVASPSDKPPVFPTTLKSDILADNSEHPAMQIDVTNITASTSESNPDDKMDSEIKRGIPRRLVLEDIQQEDETMSTEHQVSETVNEMIKKVHTSIIETGENDYTRKTSDFSPMPVAVTTEEELLDTLVSMDKNSHGKELDPSSCVGDDDDATKDDEAKDEVPDINEIQPSISAIDLAQLEVKREPLCSDAGADDLNKPPKSLQVTIEQAEADLAAITGEEVLDDDDGDVREGEACEKDIDSAGEGLTISREVVVIVKRVAEERLAENRRIRGAPDNDKEDFSAKTVVEEVEVDKEPSTEVRIGDAVNKTNSEALNIEEMESVNEASNSEETEDGQSEKASPVDSGMPTDVETPRTEEDATYSKLVLEDGMKCEESEESEGEGQVELAPRLLRRAREESPTERVKLRAVSGDKALGKPSEGKPEEDKIDEVRLSKRELRRGRGATSPVTSGTSQLSSERTLREKRPLTPSGSSDGKDETGALRTGKRRRATNVSESSVPCSSPSPSTASIDDDKDYRAWKKSILLIYDRIAAHKYASVFLKPISDDDAPGYFKIVKDPTDLTTIKRQIENGSIRTTVGFQKEILLMMSNAFIYNKSDTLVQKMASEMLPDIKEAMENMVQALGSGVPLDQLESRPPVTARVSRATVSNKNQPMEDLPSQHSPATSTKRKRLQSAIVDETRSKRKRLDLAS